MRLENLLSLRDIGSENRCHPAGALPDAFLIEVADTALGIPGYVTTVPQKLTDAPVVERDSIHPTWLGPRDEQNKR